MEDSAPTAEDETTRKSTTPKDDDEHKQTNGTAEASGNFGAMDKEEFRKRGYEMIDYIINYLDNIK